MSPDLLNAIVPWGSSVAGAAAGAFAVYRWRMKRAEEDIAENRKKADATLAQLDADVRALRTRLDPVFIAAAQTDSIAKGLDRLTERYLALQDIASRFEPVTKALEQGIERVEALAQATDANLERVEALVHELGRHSSSAGGE